MSSDATTITKLYEQIPLEAMQQVADSYMAWYVEKAIRELDATIAKLRAELEENDRQEARFKPSAAELEAMRRLQSNKVTDVDLLDRLVERGEEWLVLTMQRLDYFERAGLAPTDYPSWCEHALSGAYDWIDAGRLNASKRMFSLQGGATGPMRAIRPSDLAAINAGKSEATSPLRTEPAATARQTPQPQRAAEPAARPTSASRAANVTEPSTQPVPTIVQPATTAHEQVVKAETTPLQSPPRPEPSRQPAQAPQSPQRSTASAASSPVADAPTRPTPVASLAQESAPPQRTAPATQAANVQTASAPQRHVATPQAGSGSAGSAPQRPPTGSISTAQAAQHRSDQPAPTVRHQTQQSATASSGSAQQHITQRPQSRPTSSWNYQDQHSDPRYSLDDVDVEDLEDEGDDQGLLRKIFRVFTG